ncbi:MAG TPA: MarR family transcriptional regulator [Stellaceae bacterium]|nr:MarR family transcriptional regulator [Stellaceae bacterium]
MDDEFLELISLAERVHRRCLHLVKAELDQLAVRGINPTQALILLKIGHLAISPTDLMVRGWYTGTNPSYNIKRLVESGLISRERRTRDRRSSSLRLTDKGDRLRRLLLALYRRQTEVLSDDSLNSDGVAAATGALRRIERSLETVAASSRVETGARERPGRSPVA